MDLSILIPVYNEGESITATLQAIDQSVRTPHRIHLVYDFEEDNTLPPARCWQQNHPNLVLIRNRLGPGPANALRAGFAAVPQGAVVVVMADLADRIEDIDAMYKILCQGYSIVCGSRYMKGGEQKGGPWLKSLLSRWAGLSLYVMTGIPTRDVTNAFKMYRSNVLAAIPIESTVGFDVSIEITVKAFVRGFGITEIPSSWQERTVGTSRFRLFHWIPHYLRWYFYALLRRNRLYWIRSAPVTVAR